MPFTLTMPKLSPTMEEGTVVKWHVKENDYVDIGQLLFEVATDKATVEYNALDEGYLRKVLVEEGDEAAINQPVAVFTEEKDESVADYQPEGEMPPSAEEKPEQKKEEAPEEPARAPSGGGWQQPAFAPPAPLEEYSFPYTSEGRDRIAASPLAKKIAEEKNLDLSAVKGSGPRGRIISSDVEKAHRKGIVSFGGRRQIPQTVPGSYKEEKLTPMRKTIARRLQESKTFIPHFYARQEINAEPLIVIKDQLREVEIKVTHNDLIMRACAIALREHPGINSGFNTVNHTIVRFQTIDVAVAVGTSSGLITPIIRHTDYKSVGEISSEIRALARRAKEGKLEAHEYQGGSFTVSNLGMYGITDFQAIINPPQAAILAVSGILDVPVVREKQVVPGKVMNLTLSVDHRVVDGIGAAEFLRTLKRLLENPSILIV